MKRLKNRKGFTLIELLATIVILGVIMVVAIPNVVGILDKNRSATYITDAKKLAARAEYYVRSGKLKAKLSNESHKRCAVFNLAFLDNNEFENSPYGKGYDKERSFVIASYDGKYYVRLVEPMDKDKKSFRGISGSEVTILDKAKTQDVIENFSELGKATTDTVNDRSIRNTFVAFTQKSEELAASYDISALMQGHCYNDGTNEYTFSDNTGRDYIYLPKIADLDRNVDGIEDVESIPYFPGDTVESAITVKNQEGIVIDISQPNNKSEAYVLEVSNKYKEIANFTLKLNSDLVTMYDEAGNVFKGGYIKGDETKEYIKIYFQQTPGINSDLFGQKDYYAELTYTVGSTINTSVNLHFKTAYQPKITDSEKPVINNIEFSKGSAGKVNVKVTATDIAQSAYTGYGVTAKGIKEIWVIHNGQTFSTTITKNGASATGTVELTVPGWSDSKAQSYEGQVKAFAVDNTGNSISEAEKNSCSDNKHCMQKSYGKYQWVYTITTSCTNCSISPSQKDVLAGSRVSFSISGNSKKCSIHDSSYKPPTSVSYDGKSASVNNNSFQITMPEKNITITASTNCVIWKGALPKLWGKITNKECC